MCIVLWYNDINGIQTGDYGRLSKMKRTKEDGRDMVHEMKLQRQPFEGIKSGKKRIEMRLYDEKRSLIKVGDDICFTDMETG